MIEDGEPVKKGELANQYRLTWADAAGTQSEALFTLSLIHIYSAYRNYSLAQQYQRHVWC